MRLYGRQREILGQVYNLHDRLGYPPGARHIQYAMELNSANCIHRALSCLVAKGLVEPIPETDDVSWRLTPAAYELFGFRKR
jgi:SOS-response transcriptional repressor LexA